MFSLISAYPRQELTEDMNHLSMMELQLCPSGIVIVKRLEVSLLVDLDTLQTSQLF